VETTGDAHPCQRFGAFGFFFQLGQDGHAGTGPINQQCTAFGKSHIANGVDVTFVQIIHASPTCLPLLKSIVRPRGETVAKPEFDDDTASSTSSALPATRIKPAAHFLSLCNPLACLAHSSRLTRPGVGAEREGSEERKDKENIPSKGNSKG